VKELAQIPFHDTTIYTTVDGTYVALRPVCEALGLDVHSQRHRLQRQSWAVEVIMTSTGADGKAYEMTFIDRRTFTMWLATIDTGRLKNEHTRELVRTYQCEAADALDRYFNEGAAINPRAVRSSGAEDPALIRAKGLADLISKFRGIIADDYLDAKAKIVLARAMGDTPEIEAGARPLYIQDYLRERGATTDEVTRFASAFGRYVRTAYVAERGVEPGKRFDETPSGQVRETYAYTETDRPIFDRAWSKSYADGFPEKRARKSKEKK
jgi:hypothetical protein